MKNYLMLGVASLFVLSCGAPKIISTPIENIDATPLKTTELTEQEAQNWYHLDLMTDTIPGMSVDKTYAEIISQLPKPKKKVIVAIVDSGTDIEHEDLKDFIWVNAKEIPGNGIDDDKNGFVDDVNGWNFLGPIIKENYEFERILRDKNIVDDATYKAAEAEYQAKKAEAEQIKARYSSILSMMNEVHPKVKAALGKEDYTKDDLKNLKKGVLNDNESMFINQMLGFGLSPVELMDELQSGIDGADSTISGKSLQTRYRDALGNDENDWSTKIYGDNNVISPDPEKQDARHGTHVAGIVAANRDNNTGSKGVADQVIIMPVRTVPDGDEYDKDVALAIRYAVDNGAKVINTSFGKGYSPHSEWVRDAIKYAAEKDVLIVNAAGNDANDIDQEQTYPNDNIGTGPEVADNFLTVGAIGPKYGSNMLAGFSNYGKVNVDVFAPGVRIYSTTPNNNYSSLQGTSMASPATAGVAAMIRAYFPKLTAAQVKQVIMDSGLEINRKVVVGGNANDVRDFKSLSKSGKIVNMYNAFIMASKL